MQNTTAFTLAGQRITRELGTVRGIIVRSRSIIGNIGAGIQKHEQEVVGYLKAKLNIR